MSLFADDRSHMPVTHEIGSDLSALSTTELEARIHLMRQEIERLDMEVAAKSESRSLAERFFK